MFAMITGHHSSHLSYVYRLESDGWRYIAILDTLTRRITYQPATGQISPMDGQIEPVTVTAEHDLCKHLDRIADQLPWQPATPHLEDVHAPAPVFP